MIYFDLPLFRYLPAILRANEGKIINTVIARSFMSTSVSAESGLSGPELVKTANIPITPKLREA